MTKNERDALAESVREYDNIGYEIIDCEDMLKAIAPDDAIRILVDNPDDLDEPLSASFIDANAIRRILKKRIKDWKKQRREL